MSYLYTKIHQKGLSLITNKKLKTEEIFDFIMTHDIYYCKQIHAKSEFRDPEIFKYIPITKTKKDDIEYIKNISFIKNNRLFDLFSAHNYEVKKKFEEILLAQMKTISDLKSIFDMFPHKSIDQGFTFLINGKVDELKYTILDEAKDNEKNLFEIIDEWLLINFDNNCDLNYNCRILEINYDFTSKYYFHIFKSKEMQLIVNYIRGNIIKFFLGQNKENYYSAESLIFLLLNSPNDQFRLYVLNQMDKFIMTKEDFYQKEENQRYQLFKLFWERCGDFRKNQNIAQGNYLNEIILIKYRLINEIRNHDISYEIINNIIEEMDFYNKLDTLFKSENMDTKQIFIQLLNDVKICRERFEALEKI